MKIGLYFGSFNPIHIGHLAIANYMVEFTDLDSLWFVVSPQNPFKTKKSLLPEYQRLELVNQAIGDDFRFKASNIEFRLPKPSYTIDTLTYLKEAYPNHQFVLIMGSDNLKSFDKWKNYQQLIEQYPILVYPRPGFDESTMPTDADMTIVNAPFIEVSSSFIRDSIAGGKDVSFFMHPNTANYISEMHFYEKK
ncbi:nicotinate-nucleotide adenylyltransferase [Puteibacter caeruleilacunae]|nr:nicotinate-nucleotide adenylyltransferase [Puteibacter caeruleilacunae]